MNRIVHFDIHASDIDALQKFYEAVFDWKFTDMGPQMNGYRLIRTGEGAGIDGGMDPRRGPAPTPGAAVNAYTCTIEVDDIDAIIAKITEAGGIIVVEKTPIPGVGFLAYAKDPDGNIFGVMEQKQ